MTEEPTKTCRKCGGIFTYDKLVKHKQCANGVDSLCKECDNVYRRNYRKNHHEEYIDRTRKYYNKNKERLHKNSKKYKDSHREQVREAGRVYWRKNPEKHYINSKEWKNKNKEKVMQQQKNWQKRNPDKIKKYKYISQQNRLAKKHSLPNSLTTEQWEKCIKYFGGCCVYCGKQTTLTADHFIPLSNPECPGTIAENIVPACISCNSRKQKENPYKWINSKFNKHQAFHIICKINVYFNSILVGELN